MIKYTHSYQVYSGDSEIKRLLYFLSYFFCDIRHSLRRFTMRARCVEITLLKQRNNMKMKMIRHSESFRQKTHTRTTSCALNSRSENIFTNKKNMSQKFIWQIKDIPNFLFWHNKSMPQMMRIYWKKRETYLIFIYFIARDFS